VSLALLTVQQVLSPLMVRRAHREAEASGEEFLSSTIVCVTEAMKLVCCCAMIISIQRSPKRYIFFLIKWQKIAFLEMAKF
jgi:hypothetical protein